MGVVLAAPEVLCSTSSASLPSGAEDGASSSAMARQGPVGARSCQLTGGFTLIEALIALAILAIVLVGLLPLFAKSMTNNVEASEITEVTARARVRVEELASMPFNAEDLTVPDGETQLLLTHQWSGVDERWYEEASFPAGQTPVYSRVTKVRQFPVSALADGDLELETSEALPGGTSPAMVHFKEIEVKVNSGPATTFNLLGQRKAITLRVLKSI